MPSYAIHTVYFLSIFLLLSGCDSKTAVEKEILSYRSLFFALSQQKAAEVIFSPVDLAPPKRRELRYDSPDININIRDFFSLSGCQLNRLVGEHNSILHKHQDHVEVLFYELEFQRLTNECLAHNNESEDSIYVRLEKIAHTKAKDIKGTFFNALFSSKELQSFTSPFSALAKATELQEQDNTREAINFFAAFGRHILNAELPTLADQGSKRAEFDIALGQLERHRTAGRLLALMARYTAELTVLNGTIRDTAALAQNCQNANHRQLVSQQLRAFENFYENEYRAIQALLISHIAPLEALLNSTLPASNTYLNRYWRAHWATGQDTGSTLDRFKHSYNEHARLLMRLKLGCAAT